MPFGLSLPTSGGLAPIVNLIVPPAQQAPSQPSPPTQSQPATPPAAPVEPAPAAPSVVSPILPSATPASPPPQASEPEPAAQPAAPPAAQQPAAQPPASQQAVANASVNAAFAAPPSQALVALRDQPTEAKKVVSIDEAREAALATMEKERLHSMIRAISEGKANSVVELVKSTRGREQDTAGVRAAYAEAETYGKGEQADQRRVGSI